MPASRARAVLFVLSCCFFFVQSPTPPSDHKSPRFLGRSTSVPNDVRASRAPRYSVRCLRSGMKIVAQERRAAESPFQGEAITDLLCEISNGSSLGCPVEGGAGRAQVPTPRPGRRQSCAHAHHRSNDRIAASRSASWRETSHSWLEGAPDAKPMPWCYRRPAWRERSGWAASVFQEMPGVLPPFAGAPRPSPPGPPALAPRPPGPPAPCPLAARPPGPPAPWSPGPWPPRLLGRRPLLHRPQQGIAGAAVGAQGEPRCSQRACQRHSSSIKPLDDALGSTLVCRGRPLRISSSRSKAHLKQRAHGKRKSCRRAIGTHLKRD